jgi:HD-GYP domain-containing protein (c-di-GMP phosphodiesterase class II)
MEARMVMMEEAGRRLDSRVVSALLAALDSYTVRTTSTARGMSLAG